MAQHPDKMKWKKQIPHGLSASVFGAALGFLGKVSDYVNYERNIVGTSLEFKGCAATDHGIKTEPKSRALYEVLTGMKVYNGGFFAAANGLLGCSPDGRIFLPQHPSGPSSSPSRIEGGITANTRKPSLFKVPFSKPKSSQPSKSKVLVHSRSSQPSSSPSDEEGEESFNGTFKSRKLESEKSTAKVRLLEIKSPVRQLYGGKGENYQPFGIPRQYMAQMQGQMAIAGADECDFFVYVDSTGHVEAWRVKRSESFWKWAEPKLLQVCQWIRDGPPDWLNRSFSFDSFDFSQLEVLPLIFPFSIKTGTSLVNEIHYPFFHRFQSPYEEPFSRVGSNIDSDVAAAAIMAQSPVVRYLFSTSDVPSDEDHSSLLTVFQIVDWNQFAVALSNAIKFSLQASAFDLSQREDDVEVHLEIIDVETGAICLSLLQKGFIASSFQIHCFNRDVLACLESPHLVDPVTSLSCARSRSSSYSSFPISVSPVRELLISQ